MAGTMLYFIKCSFLLDLTMSVSWYLLLPVLLGGATVLAQSPIDGQTAEDLERGKRLFEGQCARCHGMLGAARVPV